MEKVGAGAAGLGFILILGCGAAASVAGVLVGLALLVTGVIMMAVGVPVTPAQPSRRVATVRQRDRWLGERYDVEDRR